MEIIKRGIPPSEDMFTGTCTSCGTIVEAKRGELKCYEDYRESSYSHGCPICTKIIWFKKKPKPTGGFNDFMGR